MVVAAISVDACPFLVFSHLTCHHEDTGVGIFWLVSCCPWKCVPAAISGVDIPEVPRCHLL